jgi:hypothetical protein
MTRNDLILHVAPFGKECWSGKLAAPAADGSDGPLATLAGARDAIRRLQAQPGGRDRPVTVQIAAGVYEQDETLRFDPRDGGTETYPVRYVAAPGAAPVISGGRRLTNWREIEHNGLRCWCVELPEVAAGQWNFTRLYVNDAPRQRPRLPKTGFHRFSGLAGYPETGDRWCQGPDRANFAAGEIRQWHNWQDVELVSYQLWFDTHHRFKAIDEDAQTVQFHAKSLGSLKDERGEFARYFVENVFEALDTPGQWYLDRAAGRLSYLPLPDEQLATAVIVAPRLSELLRLQGEAQQRVGHLHFENLTFAHQQWELPQDCSGYIQAAWGVPGAIILEGAERCVFYGCTVTHVNGYGLEVLAGSTENVIAACAIHDAGAGGVKIGHEQLQPHESPVGGRLSGEAPAIATTVADCTIRDCGHLYPSAIGIWIGNSGWNRIVHNRIFNCNYTGISCGWTWGYAPTRTIANRIENNHIHHINHCEILSDNGGIYTLGQQPGTVLRGNLIHDISCYGYGAWGIYPDEGSSEMRVEHNLVCGTKKAAYSTHYGRDTLVQHNIFALSQADHLGLGKRELHRSTVFRHNVCLPATGRVTGAGWQAAHYTVEKNLFWPLDGSSLTFNGQSVSGLQAEGQNGGAVVADPLFTDAAGGDFSLRPDSPVKAIGFRPFDWRGAGPRLKTRRPDGYGDYARQYPIPSLEVPVVRTRIELLTLPADVQATGVATFAVTLSNVGRAEGRGAIRLAGGPRGAAGRLSLRRIAYGLAPGAEHVAQVTMTVKRGTHTYWLDSEPADGVTVPTRTLQFDDAACYWPVPPVAEVTGPEAVGPALASVAARSLRHGDRLVAEVRLGATAEALLFSARFHEPALRPDREHPWRGTGFELIVFPPPSADAATGLPPPKRQVFLVPRAAGQGADGFTLAAAGDGVEPAPEIRASARPVFGGCDVVALIPWRHLGCDATTGECAFQLVVDVVDPAADAIVQLLAFDLPTGPGNVPLRGRLKIGTGGDRL